MPGNSLPLDIVFVTGALPFDGRTPRVASLGGSESACVFMAEALARLGARVQVFCNCTEEGEHFGVRYHNLQSWQTFRRFFECDVAVLLRDPGLLAAEGVAQLQCLWGHDILTVATAKYLQALLPFMDRMLLLSQFHADQWLGHVPALKPIITETRNGFPAELVAAEPEPDGRQPLLIYASRPERGLSHLAEIWPRIRAQAPEAKLVLCTYLHPAADKRPECLMPFERVSGLEGVESVGGLSKPEFYALLKRASALVYPSHFPEVSCIAAIEAQACGLPVIAGDYCALKETVSPEAGVLVKGDPASEEYQVEFAAAAVRALTDGAQRATWGEAGKQNSKRYAWDRIAGEWLEMFADALAWDEKNLVRSLRRHGDREALVQAGLSTDAREGLDFLRSGKAYFQHYEKAAAKEGYVDDVAQIAQSARGKWLAEQLKGFGDKVGAGKRLLDFGCQQGAFAVIAAEMGWEVVAVDCAAANGEKAEQIIAERGLAEKVRVQIAASPLDAQGGPFEAVWAGEILEHVADPRGLLEQLEQILKPGGLMLLTVPFGPWESQSWPSTDSGVRGADAEQQAVYHVRSFSSRDLMDMLEGRHPEILQTEAGTTARGEKLGWFAVWYCKPDKVVPIHRFSWQRKLRKRPQESLSVCMIVGGERGGHTLARTLESVREIADQICLTFFNAPQIAREIARPYLGRDDIVQEHQWPNRFDEARNISIAPATGDWILWIDDDEVLVGPDRLCHRLRENVYLGYVIRQVHMMVDAETVVDTPVRCFRNRRGIRFYGVIHEQPETELNHSIEPNSTLSNVIIAHDGYRDEKTRRLRFFRNLPYLERDRQEYPERALGVYFVLRDLVQSARFLCETQNIPLPPPAWSQPYALLVEAVELFRGKIPQMANQPRYHQALEWYGKALLMLGIGYEVEAQMAVVPAEFLRSGQDFKLGARARFETIEEADQYLGEMIRQGITAAKAAENEEFAFDERDDGQPAEEEAQPESQLEAVTA